MARITISLFLVPMAIAAAQFESDKPKLFVFEVKEREGESPYVELLKEANIDASFDRASLAQLLAKDDTSDNIIQYRGVSSKKNNKYRGNRHWIKYGDTKKYPFSKYIKTNKHKNNKKYNQFIDLSTLSNNKQTKNKNIDYQRNPYQQAIDEYMRVQGKQNRKGQKQNSKKFWQSKIANYIKRNSDKRSKKTYRPVHKIHVADKNLGQYYAEVQDTPSIILKQNRIQADDANRKEYVNSLSQILNPKSRSKREAEKLSLVKKIKSLVDRLKQIDNSDLAKLEGEFSYTNTNQLQGPSLALRSGGKLPTSDEEIGKFSEDEDAT